jgi:hypothetical protein
MMQNNWPLLPRAQSHPISFSVCQNEFGSSDIYLWWRISDQSGTDESVVASCTSSPEAGTAASDHHLLKFVLQPPGRRPSSPGRPHTAQVSCLSTVYSHRNQTINRKGTYILADIHGTDHFRTKLALQPYNKFESCVSKIHTPMVMVWFGNV